MCLVPDRRCSIWIGAMEDRVLVMHRSDTNLVRRGWSKTWLPVGGASGGEGGVLQTWWRTALAEVLAPRWRAGGARLWGRSVQGASGVQGCVPNGSMPELPWIGTSGFVPHGHEWFQWSRLECCSGLCFVLYDIGAKGRETHPSGLISDCRAARWRSQ